MWHVYYSQEWRCETVGTRTPNHLLLADNRSHPARDAIASNREERVLGKYNRESDQKI